MGRQQKGLELAPVALPMPQLANEVLDQFLQQQRIITTYGTADEKGTGLGMLICYAFIALNHGHLRLVSETARVRSAILRCPRHRPPPDSSLS